MTTALTGSALSSEQRFGGIRAVVGTLLIVNLFVFSMTIGILRWNRERAEEAAARTAQNLAQVLERQLVGELKKIDLALFALRDEMARPRAGGRAGDQALNAYIERLFHQFPELNSIRIADADGRISHGIGVQAGSHFSVADRAYFQEARRNPGVGLLISEPVVGRISGQWVIIFARRASQVDGRFAGVAYAAMTLDEFTHSLAAIDLGPNGTATLRGGNLEIFAKYPRLPNLGDPVGRREVSSTFQELLRQGRASGVYKARGGFDGIERIFAFTKVGPHPLYLHVGFSPKDYLARWRAVAHWSWSMAGLFTLLTSFLAWLLHRAWKRERERALAEVHELRGLLPICAACKKIRDDAGYWNQIETYIQARSSAQFTHGLCPECVARLYPSLSSERLEE